MRLTVSANIYRISSDYILGGVYHVSEFENNYYTSAGGQPIPSSCAVGRAIECPYTVWELLGEEEKSLNLVSN